MKRHLKYIPLAVVFANCNNKPESDNVPSGETRDQIIDPTKTTRPNPSKDNSNNLNELKEIENFDQKKKLTPPNIEPANKFDTPLEQLLQREATDEEKKFWTAVQLNDKNEIPNIYGTYNLVDQIEHQALLDFAFKNIFALNSAGIIPVMNNFDFIKKIVPKVNNPQLIYDASINAIHTLLKISKYHSAHMGVADKLIDKMDPGKIDENFINKTFIELFKSLLNTSEKNHKDNFKSICESILKKIKNQDLFDTAFNTLTALFNEVAYEEVINSFHCDIDTHVMMFNHMLNKVIATNSPITKQEKTILIEIIKKFSMSENSYTAADGIIKICKNKNIFDKDILNVLLSKVRENKEETLYNIYNQIIQISEDQKDYIDYKESLIDFAKEILIDIHNQDYLNEFFSNAVKLDANGDMVDFELASRIFHEIDNSKISEMDLQTFNKKRNKSFSIETTDRATKVVTENIIDAYDILQLLPNIHDVTFLKKALSRSLKLDDEDKMNNYFKVKPIINKLIELDSFDTKSPAEVCNNFLLMKSDTISSYYDIKNIIKKVINSNKVTEEEKINFFNAIFSTLLPSLKKDLNYSVLEIYNLIIPNVTDQKSLSEFFLSLMTDKDSYEEYYWAKFIEIINKINSAEFLDKKIVEKLYSERPSSVEGQRYIQSFYKKCTIKLAQLFKDKDFVAQVINELFATPSFTDYYSYESCFEKDFLTQLIDVIDDQEFLVALFNKFLPKLSSIKSPKYKEEKLSVLITVILSKINSDGFLKIKSSDFQEENFNVLLECYEILTKAIEDEHILIKIIRNSFDFIPTEYFLILKQHTWYRYEDKYKIGSSFYDCFKCAIRNIRSDENLKESLFALIDNLPTNYTQMSEAALATYDNIFTEILNKINDTKIFSELLSHLESLITEYYKNNNIVHYSFKKFFDNWLKIFLRLATNLDRENIFIDKIKSFKSGENSDIKINFIDLMLDVDKENFSPEFVKNLFLGESLKTIHKLSSSEYTKLLSVAYSRRVFKEDDQQSILQIFLEAAKINEAGQFTNIDLLIHFIDNKRFCSNVNITSTFEDVFRNAIQFIAHGGDKVIELILSILINNMCNKMDISIMNDAYTILLKSLDNEKNTYKVSKVLCALSFNVKLDYYMHNLNNKVLNDTFSKFADFILARYSVFNDSDLNYWTNIFKDLITGRCNDITVENIDKAMMICLRSCLSIDKCSNLFNCIITKKILSSERVNEIWNILVKDFVLYENGCVFYSILKDDRLRLENVKQGWNEAISPSVNSFGLHNSTAAKAILIYNKLDKVEIMKGWHNATRVDGKYRSLGCDSLAEEILASNKLESNDIKPVWNYLCQDENFISGRQFMRYVIQNNRHYLDNEDILKYWESTITIREEYGIVDDYFAYEILDFGVLDATAVRKGWNNLMSDTVHIRSKLTREVFSSCKEHLTEDDIHRGWASAISMDAYDSIASENLARKICMYRRNGNYIILNAELELYANQLGDDHDTQLRSLAREELYRRDRQLYRHFAPRISGGHEEPFKVRESIIKIKEQDAYKALEEKFKLKIEKVKNKVKDPREEIKTLAKKIYEEADEKGRKNEVDVIHQFDRKDKITDQQLYILLAALDGKSDDEKRTFILQFELALIANLETNRVDTNSCRPQNFIIAALISLNEFEFLSFYADEAYEWAQYGKNDPKIIKEIEQNKITNALFLQKEAMLKLAKNPGTFMEKLQTLANNEGGDEILKDQECRIKIIYEYYLALIKDQELRKRQEESETKLQALKNNVQGKSLKEVFDLIRSYMDSEYGGLYAEMVAYKEKFEEIFEKAKCRKMNGSELSKLEKFISQYFKEEKGPEYTDEEKYKEICKHVNNASERHDILEKIAAFYFFTKNYNSNDFDKFLANEDLGLIAPEDSEEMKNFMKMVKRFFKERKSQIG